MDDGVKDRVRVQLARDAATCPRCERQELRLMRSRDMRTGLAKVNPFWDAHEKTYERCKVCGFRRAVSGSATTQNTEVAQAREKRPVLTALGWTAVVLMIVLIAVLTVVLAGILLVVSVWLTVAVPLVVLLVVVGVAAYARRS